MNPETTALTRRDALRFLGLAGAAALLPAFVTRSVAADTASTPANAAGDPPQITGDQAGYFRFKIGAFDAVALSDGGFGGPLTQSPWPAASAQTLATALGAAFMPTDSFSLPFNNLLVRMNGELVLVDAGAGPLFGPTNGRLLSSLAAIGVKPAQITAVILTHAHGDHFGGLLDAETGAPAFPHAQHFVHKREYEFWTGSAPDLSGAAIPPEAHAGAVVSAQKFLGALRDRWQFIVPGDKILAGLEILDAPGHTPGHIALEFASGDAQLLHFVDTVHHHAISFAHPEVPFAYDVQPELAVATRRRLLDRAAADRTRLFGAHMPFPALGYVRRKGDSYEHVIEPSPV